MRVIRLEYHIAGIALALLAIVLLRGIRRGVPSLLFSLVANIKHEQAGMIGAVLR